ncbi:MULTISPECIES: hypothetical protein [Chryseobacterium]|uniref:Uncharacterized protein n=3 Tax=Chryseobacterium TaxID=59732 RepID=A0A3D9BE83_9FLAO|nr:MULTISPECIES: hypothetical protein [Chryseobacterium]MDO3423828.1 hypothetical protein [Chryseobacterium sp. APV1]OVE58230.1 hypothetical protein B0E34_08625 [Chryseobacterium mucoviscidosis]REC51706.1 hypothetical protein DRF68_05325 [Candidatus Chryseobacterium massiliae]
MKKIALVIFSIFSLGYYAQVGIKTTTPVGLLDINGDLNINKEMRMGGTNTVKGSAGTAGTIFHNNSDLAVNDWKSVKIADGQGSMSLFSMNTVSDQTGVTFSGNNGSTSPYAENSALTSDWTVITGAQDTYSVTNTTNKVVFTFQTTAQKTNNSNSSSGFACGIFVDDLLKAVRTDVLIGTDGSYKIYNMNTTLTNVTPKNNYKVKVACTKRNLNSGTLGIGTAVNTNFLNSDMSQSVLTTSVLQPY